MPSTDKGIGVSVGQITLGGRSPFIKMDSIDPDPLGTLAERIVVELAKLPWPKMVEWPKECQDRTTLALMLASEYIARRESRA